MIAGFADVEVKSEKNIYLSKELVDKFRGNNYFKILSITVNGRK